MSITYDLYVKQSDRWLLEKQFLREERSDAVSEAERVLSLPGVAAVRVIGERYDGRTDMATEHTVFDSSEELVPATPQAQLGRKTMPGARSGVVDSCRRMFTRIGTMNRMSAIKCPGTICRCSMTMTSSSRGRP